VSGNVSMLCSGDVRGHALLFHVIRFDDGTALKPLSAPLIIGATHMARTLYPDHFNLLP
jgi:hypothetical protein